MSYRFVKIAGFYRNFLKYYYNTYPGVKERSYQEQYDHLMGQNFGYADSFAKAFRSLGIEAQEILHNAGPLQAAWAKEHGSGKMGHDLIIAQLKHLKPEVVYIQDGTHFSAQFVNTIRNEVPSVRIITGYYCSPYAPDVFDTFRSYDFILSCSPQFQQILNTHDIPNYLLYHAFNPRVLDTISTTEKSLDMLFVGSFISQKDFHSERLRFVEAMLAQDVPLALCGSIEVNKGLTLLGKQVAYGLSRFLPAVGLKNYVANHPILNKFQRLAEMPQKTKVSNRFIRSFIAEPKYGSPMFELLSKAKIGFNIHGGIAGDYAANIRMFEVTGVNSLLLTEEKKNIRDLFEPDREIVTYSSLEECIEKTKWLLEHKDELQKISSAGQQRTLKDHTVQKRVELLDGIFRKYL